MFCLGFVQPLPGLCCPGCLTHSSLRVARQLWAMTSNRSRGRVYQDLVLR